MPLLDRLIASSIGWIPKPLVRRVAARYVAGETLDDALRMGGRLVAEGCCATFDLLGEFITEESQADASAEEYRRLLDRIHAEKLDANVSVKLTAFGLLLDRERAYARLRAVVTHARDLGNFVRIDMEDSACTDATLDLYRRLRADGFVNVGVVLQAYLKRTLRDVENLSPLKPSYRLCKGIYREAASIAYTEREQIRDNYRAALRAMFDAGSYVGIATHDDVLIDDARGLVTERGFARGQYEFQMLLGVTEPRRRRLVEEGHRLRVYVPYGKDWYGYSVRRLKENPSIGRYVFLALFKRRGR